MPNAEIERIAEAVWLLPLENAEPRLSQIVHNADFQGLPYSIVYLESISETRRNQPPAT